MEDLEPFQKSGKPTRTLARFGTCFQFFGSMCDTFNSTCQCQLCWIWIDLQLQTSTLACPAIIACFKQFEWLIGNSLSLSHELSKNLIFVWMCHENGQFCVFLQNSSEFQIPFLLVAIILCGIAMQWWKLTLVIKSVSFQHLLQKMEILNRKFPLLSAQFSIPQFQRFSIECEKVLHQMHLQSELDVDWWLHLQRQCGAWCDNLLEMKFHFGMSHNKGPCNVQNENWKCQTKFIRFLIQSIAFMPFHPKLHAMILDLKIEQMIILEIKENFWSLNLILNWWINNHQFWDFWSKFPAAQTSESPH